MTMTRQRAAKIIELAFLNTDGHVEMDEKYTSRELVDSLKLAVNVLCQYQTMLDKACEFLKDKGNGYISIVDGQLVLRKGMIKDFIKYMQGE